MTRDFRYDVENRQVSAVIGGNTTAYAYDGDGRRVMKIEGTTNPVKTVYVYDAAGQLAQEYGGSGGSTPARSYVFTDHLGSTRMTLGTLRPLKSRGSAVSNTANRS